MTNCITYVWRGEARRWLLLGRVPQNVHYYLTTYRSPRPCFHVVCLFKISMQASVISTCNLPLLAARRRYLTDLSNVHVILGCLFMGLLLSKLHVMSCLCPTVQQQQHHCALLHESLQTAQRSWFMSSFLFFSFLFISFFLIHQSRFYVSFGVARSCMTTNIHISQMSQNGKVGYAVSKKKADRRLSFLFFSCHL